MTQKTRIQDGHGTSNEVMVTEFGQQVTGSISYSTTVARTLNVINTAFNFVTPISGKRIVITEILLYANRSIGVNDATVDLYEADGINDTAISKSIIQTEMLKQTSRDLISLNLIVSEGKWVNAKTDDATVFATIMYYYIPV